jgi:hypothetical protein
LNICGLHPIQYPEKTTETLAIKYFSPPLTAKARDTKERKKSAAQLSHLALTTANEATDTDGPVVSHNEDLNILLFSVDDRHLSHEF